MRKHRYDSIAEGIGLDRITTNFERARIDSAIRGVNTHDILYLLYPLLMANGRSSH